MYDTQMVMRTGTRKYDVSLASEFQKCLSTVARKHGVIYQGKYKKRAGTRKWTEMEYDAQNDAGVANKAVKMFCNKTSFHN